MPKLNHRIIYDDDGEAMTEGLMVLINSKYERIMHFDSDGEISFEDFNAEDIETVEYLRDARFIEIEIEDDVILNESKS